MNSRSLDSNVSLTQSLLYQDLVHFFPSLKNKGIFPVLDVYKKVREL